MVGLKATTPCIYPSILFIIYASDNPQFNRLRDELQVTYTKAIEDEEVKTHERIETYKAQQEEALSKYQQDAKDDLQRLLHMISNVLHKPTTPEPSLVPTSSSTDNLPVVEGKKSPGRHKVRFEETNESDKNTIKRQTPSNLGKAVENHKASAQHDADSEDDGDAGKEGLLWDLGNSASYMIFIICYIQQHQKKTKICLIWMRK